MYMHIYEAYEILNTMAFSHILSVTPPPAITSSSPDFPHLCSDLNLSPYYSSFPLLITCVLPSSLSLLHQWSLSGFLDFIRTPN